MSKAIWQAPSAELYGDIRLEEGDLTPFQWLRVALPILAIAFACLALADTRNLMITAMVLQGVGMGLAGPAFMAGASLAVEPHEQGAVAGIAGSCGPLGFTVGPLLGGFFYQISPDLPYWFTFAISLPLLVFVMRQRRGEKRRDQRIAAQEDSAS